MAAPVWSQPTPSKPATLSRVGLFMERMLYRSGGDSLADHLESTYGVPVAHTRELDLGVYRVDRADGTRWVARVFPATRSAEAVRADAEVLDWLADHDIPAERCADRQAVSVHANQPVMVTEFVPGRKAAATPSVFQDLGELLGRLQLLVPGPTPAGRTGGAWHHIALDAGAAEELATARCLVDSARHRVARADRSSYETLSNDLDHLDSFDDLPHAFGHPDLVPRNESGLRMEASPLSTGPGPDGLRGYCHWMFALGGSR